MDPSRARAPCPRRPHAHHTTGGHAEEERSHPNLRVVEHRRLAVRPDPAQIVVVRQDHVLSHDRVLQAESLVERFAPGTLAELTADRQGPRAPGLVVPVPGRELGQPPVARVLALGSHLGGGPLKLAAIDEARREQAGRGQALLEHLDRSLVTLVDPGLHVRLVDRGHQDLGLQAEPMAVDHRSTAVGPALDGLQHLIREVVEIPEPEQHRAVRGHRQPILGKAPHERVEPVLLESPQEVGVPLPAHVLRHARRHHPGRGTCCDLVERPIEPELRIDATLAQLRDPDSLIPGVLAPLVRSDDPERTTVEVANELLDHRGLESVADLHGVRHALAGGGALELRDDRTEGTVEIPNHDDVRPHHVDRIVHHRLQDPFRLLVREQRAESITRGPQLPNRVVKQEDRSGERVDLHADVLRQDDGLDARAPRHALEALVANAGRIHRRALLGEIHALTRMLVARDEPIVVVDVTRLDRAEVRQGQRLTANRGPPLEHDHVLLLAVAAQNVTLEFVAEADVPETCDDVVVDRQVVRPRILTQGDARESTLPLVALEHLAAPLRGALLLLSLMSVPVPTATGDHAITRALDQGNGRRSDRCGSGGSCSSSVEHSLSPRGYPVLFDSSLGMELTVREKKWLLNCICSILTERE